MKGTIIIVIAVFVIIATAKTSEGKRCCCGSGSSKKPERKKADENRNVVFAEDKGQRTEEGPEIKNVVLHGNSTLLTKYLHPVFMKRKICCICKLPLCICKICKDPESWFLNPKLRAPKQEHEISSAKPVKVTGRKAKEKANSTDPRVPSLKEYNIQNRKYKKGGFKLQCDCMKCKLCSTGKCAVILKCDCCGPLHLNGTSKKINFSKLLFKMNNKLNVKTKFLEISHS